QLGWLPALFGGFQAARYWHFWIVWLFVGFTIMHVILVFVVDPASLRAMITGWYRGRFPSHDCATDAKTPRRQVARGQPARLREVGRRRGWRGAGGRLRVGRGRHAATVAARLE